MFNKDLLLKFISAQQQKSQPIVSNQGFKNGAPPAGTNYRIPSDTLYNPTPFQIKAVSDNGIEKVLQPNDTNNVHFPGAQYVDEYQMKSGGLTRFLPKAQPGLEVKVPAGIQFIPADADRYGMNKFIQRGDDTQYVDPRLLDELQQLQTKINQSSQNSSSARQDYENRVLAAINKIEPQHFNVLDSDYIPSSVRNSEDAKENGLFGCISGVCYTLNEAGEPVKYYSNSQIQDDVKNGVLKDWVLDYDTKNIGGGDIMQFTGNRGVPHHATLVVPNSIKHNKDGTITFDVFMNNGNSEMFRESYTLDPKTDKVQNGETVQLLKRKSVSDLDEMVKQRDQLRAQIEAADPAAFKKGRARRWNTYMPGAFTETGVQYSNFEGQDPERMVAGSMMGNLNLDDAGRLLTKNTINSDIDYAQLRQTGGFENILNQVNDPDFKMKFMKDHNITNREYNAIVKHSFGIYGQESGFGTKTGGIEETDFARYGNSKWEDLWSRLSGNGQYHRNIVDDYSRGLTQVKLRNIDNKYKKQYGINEKSIETDPTKAFLAAMVINAQNLPQLRKLAASGETDALNNSNYLDFIPYMYNQPGRLKRGDRKTIEAALEEGEDPAKALVIDPNSPMANNEYIKNVRTYSDLIKFMPTENTMPLESKKFGGSLDKYQKAGKVKRKSQEAPTIDYANMNNADQRAEYEAGWKAYSQGAQQWVDMLNREEDKKGRELTADEKVKFIEKFVKPSEGERKFNYDRANDRRFDFLFDSGYTTWNSKEGAPEYVLRKPVVYEEKLSELDKKLQNHNSEWLKGEDTPFGRSLGFDPRKSPEARERAYAYAKTKVAEELLAKNPQGDRNRVDWLNSFTPEERNIISQSQAGYKFAPDMGTQFRQGAANLFGMNYRDEDLTPTEAKEASRLGVFAPLSYSSNLVKGAISGDFGSAVKGKSAKPMTYGSLESYVQPNSTAAIEELALAGMDPLNLVGIGLLDNAGRVGKVGQVVNAADNVANASIVSPRVPQFFRTLGYNASKWNPKGDSSLAKFIRNTKSPELNEHLYGLGHGIADVIAGERPFFEVFPMTKAQKESIWAKQDAALAEGEQFAKDWIYGPDGKIRPEVVNRIQTLDPVISPSGENLVLQQGDQHLLTPSPIRDIDDPANILTTNPAMMVSSRSRHYMKDPRLSDSMRHYFLENRGAFLGVADDENNITLRNMGFYHIDPKSIAHTAAHETGHVFQKFGNPFYPTNSVRWSDAISKFDSRITPYTTANPNTPIGKKFADAMVEAKSWESEVKKFADQRKTIVDDATEKSKKLMDSFHANEITEAELNNLQDALWNPVKEQLEKIREAENLWKKDNRSKYYTWKASPKELHSELMPARMDLVNRYMKELNMTKEEAIQAVQNPTDEMIDYMIHSQNLNRFFKPTTSAADKRELIRYLPSVAMPAIGIGGIGMYMKQNQPTNEGYATGGTILANTNNNMSANVPCFECGGFYAQGGEMIKRADGSYSQRGFWDNIRDNIGSGKKPTKEMLDMEAKLNRKEEGGIHLDPAKKGTFTAQATRMGMGIQEAASHILANKDDYSPEMVKKAVFAHNFAKMMGGMVDHDFDTDTLEIMAEGGIPQRYKNMGFTHVGQKKQGDGQHKWKVLAKKGDQYKVVQGGYRGMEDFHQHHDPERRKRFWDRMGGRDSATAKDPFSPLYWHKRFGTWAEGGELDMFDDGGDYDKYYRDGDFRTDYTTSHTLNDLANNGWNSGLAAANNLGNPNSMIWALPNKGFGSGLKAFAGAAAGLSGAVLGYEKLFNGNKTTNSTLYNGTTGEFGKTEDVLKARAPKPVTPVTFTPSAQPSKTASFAPYGLTPKFFEQLKNMPVKSNMTSTGGSGMGAMEKSNNYQEQEQSAVTSSVAPVSTTTNINNTPATQPAGIVNRGQGTLKQDTEGNFIYGSDATGWHKSMDRNVAEAQWRNGNYNHTPAQAPAAPVSIPNGLQNFMNGVQIKRDGGLTKFWPGGPFMAPGNPLQSTFNAQGIGVASNGNTISGGNYMDFNGASPEQIKETPPTVGTPNPKVQMQQQWSTTQYGDPAGFIAANNALNGFGMMNDVLSARDYQKQYNKHLRDMGNTDAIYSADNPVNPFGSYTTNVGPGSNYSLVTNGFAQDFGTKGVAAKFGGAKQFRKGGTYNVSETELLYILANGGEIEFI